VPLKQIITHSMNVHIRSFTMLSKVHQSFSGNRVQDDRGSGLQGEWIINSPF